MAGMAAPAARLRVGPGAGRLVPPLGMGRPSCGAVVLGSGPDSDRCLLPPPKRWAALVAEGRCALAQPPDPDWRSVVDPPRPGFVAVGHESHGISMGVRRGHRPGSR